MKDIAGQLTTTVKTQDGREETLQIGNVAFRQEILRFVRDCFNTTQDNPRIGLLPYKSPNGYPTHNETVRHGMFYTQSGNYPSLVANTSQISVKDYLRFKASGSFPAMTATDTPMVVGAVASYDAKLSSSGWGNNVMSIAELPREYTQIGSVYLHPLYTGTMSTAAGTNYVNVGAGVMQNHYWQPGRLDLLRIESGSDKGVYLVRHFDRGNGRLYVTNLDGTLPSFVGTTAPVGFSWRRAFFNETNIIASGTGSVIVEGKFFPGEARMSFMLRIFFEKSGSPPPTDAAQVGSYWFSLRPYHYGDGVIQGSTVSLQQGDQGFLNDHIFGISNGVPAYGHGFWGGGTVGMALDRVNQRLWTAMTDGTTSSIYYWLYKTSETFHEVATTASPGAGQGAELNPVLNLSGTVTRCLDMDSEGTVYIACSASALGTASNAGLVLIRPNLTTTHLKAGDGLPGAEQLLSVAIDRSRYRTGTAGDCATVAGTNQLISPSANFLSSDTGRVISLSGATAENGQYLITSVVDSTTVALASLNGAGLLFSGSAGGTFRIGDRVYLFYGTATQNANRLTYMETLAVGWFYTQAVTMTNGRQVTAPTKWGECRKVDVDQVTGNLYWLSQDTQLQVNWFDVSTRTHSFRTIANLQSPSGGTGTISNITLFSALKCNPKFGELWVGTDQGHIRIPLSNFSGSAHRRFFGFDTTTYANPAGFQRAAGSSNAYVRNYAVGIDGKTYAVMATGGNQEMVTYGREADNWFFSDYGTNPNNVTHVMSLFLDPYGMGLSLYPSGWSNHYGFFLHPEVQYQWIDGQWVPKEVVRGALPNKTNSDTISPGLKARDLHTTAQALLHGATVRFSPQGGATPANNEFLGRAGATGASRSDGATTSGSANFDGTGFAAGDTGRFLRIESGTDQGTYLINSFVSATRLTLKKLGPTGAPFSASGTAGALGYSIWDAGTAGSNAGPEVASVLLADGFSKDNTQDVSGINYEWYWMRTVLSEHTEPIKFCTDVLGPPGSAGPLVYHELFARNGANYAPALGAHQAVPSTPTVRGTDLLDGASDMVLNGTLANANAIKASLRSSNDTIWHGSHADNDVVGYQTTVDLGAATEVGSVIIRGQQLNTAFTPPALASTDGSSGAILHLLNAQGTAPTDSSTIRTSGIGNLNLVYRNTTITLASGDFLGSTTLAAQTDGVIVGGGNSLAAASNPFLPSHVGQVLRLTAGAGSDNGAYRILTVAGDGSSCTLRQLDQTSKQWSATTSGVTYQVQDAVQDEDLLAVPSLAAVTHRLVVERLLSPTTAQVRIPSHSNLSGQNWQCVKPSWRMVKRVSYSIEATPPDVKNNGTWVGADGKGAYTAHDYIVFLDLSDLPSVARTSRFWRWMAQTRYTTTAQNAHHSIDSMEFYSPSGAPIGFCSYNRLDSLESEPAFLSCSLNRLDFIQANHTGVGSAGVNGLASTSGPFNTSVALASGNRFLGFQVRAKRSDGATGSGSNLFAGGGFTSSDVGRILWILTGASSGFYRISAVNSATQVTLVSPSGSPVAFGGVESTLEYQLHEGIQTGLVAADCINFGAVASGREYAIKSISDDLRTLTLGEGPTTPQTAQAWEIRRKALQDSATSPSPNPAVTARIITSQGAWGSYPLQPGDVTCDTRGYLRFHANDVGGVSRSDGSTLLGSNVFGGSGFCPDDVGRVLIITTGNDRGAYRISTFTSSTSIAVQNLYTGAVVAFTNNAGGLGYRIMGERRFRAARYTTVLRA